MDKDLFAPSAGYLCVHVIIVFVGFDHKDSNFDWTKRMAIFFTHPSPDSLNDSFNLAHLMSP